MHKIFTEKPERLCVSVSEKWKIILTKIELNNGVDRILFEDT